MTVDRSTILAAKPKQRTIHVPAWGGDVIVRGMTAGERDQYEAALFDASGGKLDAGAMADLGGRAGLVVRCLVDGNGTRLLGDDDADQLADTDAAAVNTAWDVAMELSGMRPEDVGAAEGN